MGHVWVGTNGQGIVKLNPIDNITANAFTKHQVRAITKDTGGDIWIGSGAGRSFNRRKCTQISSKQY
jgi:ligand-binding sensor domain-containing protein